MRFKNLRLRSTGAGFFVSALVAAFGSGCSGAGSDVPPGGAGGSVEVGGSTGMATGGSLGIGGGAATGGSSVTPAGGASVVVQTGGAPTVQTGGAAPVQTGGASALPTGGRPGVGGGSLGGAAPTGGRAGTGGAAPTGGTPNAGTGGSTVVQPASCNPPKTGHYQMEDLDRGVVAVKVTGGVYVGWRMMGYEYDATTPANVSYNLYKGGTKLASVTNSTNYLDAAGTTTSSYSVAAVIGGTECAQSAAVTPWAQQYLRIPLTPPATGPNGGTYSASDGATGDLDGDGKLDIVLKWDPSNSKDNSQSGMTDDVFIDGYTLAGTRLWRIDLGTNIRAGAHYTQMSVGDFDGDGRAELAVKTAPGTKDGTGNYLSTGVAAGADNSASYVTTTAGSSYGFILSGPEWLTVFDGTTGKELATVNYPVQRGTVSSWGDSYGNRLDRYNGGMAFVKDGGIATGRPSIIQQRGYYTRLTVSALTWRNGTLAQNWIFDSNGAGNSKAAGQGDHSCMAADVDNDGAQEIIPGASTISSNGTFRCTSGRGHGDAMHVGELIVGKGITTFSVHEGSPFGMDAHSADTCAFYTDVPGTADTGRGVAEYVGASDTTAATCSSGVGNVNCSTGAASGNNAGSNFLIYWTADDWRSTMNGTTLPGTDTSGTASCNGSKSTPTLTADLLGDWREEAVLRESNNTGLRVYTTTNVNARRIYTLMHDPTYRAQVAFENSSYNQPPHTGFAIHSGMTAAPKPDIFIVPRVK